MYSVLTILIDYYLEQDSLIKACGIFFRFPQLQGYDNGFLKNN